MCTCWLHLSSFIWNEQRNNWFFKSNFKISIFIPLPFTSKILVCSGQGAIRQNLVLALGNLHGISRSQKFQFLEMAERQKTSGVQEGWLSEECQRHRHVLRSNISSSIHLCHSKMVTKTLSLLFLNFDCLTLQPWLAFDIAIHRSQIYALHQNICCIIKEVCVFLVFNAGIFNFCIKPLSSSLFRSLQYLIGVRQQAHKPRPSFP